MHIFPWFVSLKIFQVHKNTWSCQSSKLLPSCSELYWNPNQWCQPCLCFPLLDTYQFPEHKGRRFVVQQGKIARADKTNRGFNTAETELSACTGRWALTWFMAHQQIFSVPEAFVKGQNMGKCTFILEMYCTFFFFFFFIRHLGLKLYW